MGTNYYAVKSEPTISEPIHIGKSSSGWMFLFHGQHDLWNDPPIEWHSFDELKAWLERYVVQEISKQLGMRPEEVFRLSDFSRDDFLKILIGGQTEYSKAYIVKDI